MYQEIYFAVPNLLFYKQLIIFKRKATLNI